jgi:hypothetical protein
MVRAECPRGVKRGIGEIAQRQRRELGVYTPVMISHASRTYPTAIRAVTQVTVPRTAPARAHAR